ncbi:hypothetical protein NMG60_11028101 [Bertholletia excelsa]
MGGVAVLQPQDCLRDRLPGRQTLIHSSMKQRRNANPVSGSNPNSNSTRCSRRKRSPEKKKNSNNSSRSKSAIADKVQSKNLVMGQVKILKRGEELSAMKDRIEEKRGEELSAMTDPIEEKKLDDVVNSDDLLLSATDRIGPEPEMVPIGLDFYAGSAVISSPPPSSVPLPAFFTRRSGSGTNNDFATLDLRRLLRLQL